MNWVPGNNFSMGYFLLPLDVARSQAQFCTHTHEHLYLDANITGTGTGLSKMPYLR